MPAISTPFAVDGEREYWEVMAVMDHRFINETEIIYNVKWKLRLGEVPSWPDSENWVQESEMKCPELLEQYWLEFRKKLKPFFRKDYTRREAFDLYLARKMRQWSCSLSKQDLEVCTGLPTINHGVEKTDLVEQVITVPAFLLGPITIKINSNESPEPPEIIEILDSDDEIPLKPSNEEAKKCKVEIKSSLEINGSSIKNDQDFSKKMNILKNYASDFLGREFNPDNLQKKSESMFSISKPGVNKEKNNENESLSHAKANCGYESIDDYEVEEMEDAQCIVDSRKKLSSRNLPSFYTVKRKITPEDKEDSTHAPINKKKINASSNLSLSASKSNISSNSLSPILRPNNSINKISKSPSNIINQSVTIDSKSEKLYTQLLIKKFEEAKEGKSQALQRGYEAIDVLYILRESISGKMFCLTFFMNPENDIESFFVPIDDAIAMFPLWSRLSMFSVLTEAEKIKVLEAVAKRKYASIEAERVSRAERKKNKEGKPRKPPCECSEFNKNNLPRTIQITLGTGIERTIVTRSVPPKNPRYIPPPFPLGHCSCFTNNRSDDEDSSPPPEKKMSLQEAREEILKDVLSLSSMNAEQTTSEEGAKRFKAAVDNILESNNPYLQLFVDKFLEGKINRSGLQNGHKPIEVVCFVKNRRTEKKMCLVLLLTNKNELEGCITEYEEMVTFFPEVVKRCLRRCRRQKIFKPRIIPPRSPSTSTPPSSSSSLSPSPHLSSSPAPLDSSGSPTTSVLPSASTSAPPQTLASSHTSTSSEV